MRGAIVFLAVFIIMLIVTLQYSSLPPGRMLYSLLNVPETTYPVLGFPATLLVCAVFNGVVYGIVAWLIYTIAERPRSVRAHPERVGAKPRERLYAKKFCINCGSEISLEARYCPKCGEAQQE
ncbi:zinc ribbon domain-containing protein [Candidatus Bathyarchaeota archaeon]|nr:zinc ribbon domain-containing protein [Candidatus Bathyarchaeota archaeon]MBS7628691.1 zinc ribbon domain-containing protein [Candidatus Bathyarchaeota archaeon]